MRKGLSYSLLLHACLFLLLLFGLPHMKRDLPMQQSITVDIVKIGERNAAPVKQKENPPPQPQKTPELPQPQPIPPAPQTPPPPQPAPPAAQEAPKPPEPKPAEKKEPLPTPEKKAEKPAAKQEKKKPEPEKKIKKPTPLRTLEKPKEVTKTDKQKPKKPKEKPASFDDVLKSVSDFKEKEEVKESADEQSAEATATEEEAWRNLVRNQVGQHWSVDGGARDADSTIVSLRLLLDDEGNITNVEVIDTIKFNTDPVYYAAALRALRAVKATERIEGLPKEHYAKWQQLDMNFDPRDMFQ